MFFELKRTFLGWFLWNISFTYFTSKLLRFNSVCLCPLLRNSTIKYQYMRTFIGACWYWQIKQSILLRWNMITFVTEHKKDLEVVWVFYWNEENVKSSPSGARSRHGRSLVLKAKTKGSWHSEGRFLVDVQPWKWIIDPSNRCLATAACLVDPLGESHELQVWLGDATEAASGGASARSGGLGLRQSGVILML